MRVENMIVCRKVGDTHGNETNIEGMLKTLWLEEFPGKTPALSVCVTTVVSRDVDHNIRWSLQFLNPSDDILDEQDGDPIVIPKIDTYGKYSPLVFGFSFPPTELVTPGEPPREYKIRCMVNGEIARETDLFVRAGKEPVLEQDYSAPRDN